jgi:30S ribosomal protein S31
MRQQNAESSASSAAVETARRKSAYSRVAILASQSQISRRTGNMGKGDTRTRRGKIYNGSYGKKRPHRAGKGSAPATPAQRPTKAR